MENQDFKKLPSLEQLKVIIDELNNANFNLVSYNKLVTKLRQLQFIPFPTAKLNVGYHIERGRINEPGEIFTSEKELSYRTDYNNITKYGRANVPHDSLFYGAIESDVIKHPRLINMLETSQIFRNLDKEKVDNADFVMTVGKWRIIEEMEIVEIVFNENSIENSEDVRKSYQFHLEKLKTDLPDYVDQFEYILKFFSNQFAKKEINSHLDYMISAAYTDLAINFRGFPGLKYPSVKSDYMGHNVVLNPRAVDNFLELEIAAMYRITKEKDNTLISPIAHATEFGPLNSNFKWVDYEPEKIVVEK
jgi:hypothetical protein